MTESIKELLKNDIIVYGAGATGHKVYDLLKGAGYTSQIILADSYKSGLDDKTGMKIVKPEELKNHLAAVVIIGIPEYLRPRDVEEVLNSLKAFGFVGSQIIMFTQLLNMFADQPQNRFDWQSYSDDVYDWNTNIYLIEQLSKYIEKQDSSVVDLGAGSMNLKKFISPDVSYTPVDFKRRCDETVVCDFNKGQYPDILADVYVLCAMLYYIDEPKKLLEEVASHAGDKIIVALNSVDLSKYPEVMHTHGFRNYMFFEEIAEILRLYGFTPSIDVTLHKVVRRFVVYEKR